MKYIRKTPVEAIQWKGDNAKEVKEFINNAANPCCACGDGSGSLVVVGKDLRKRTFKAVIHKFGWVVREGKTFRFYNDKTFRMTFEEAKEDGIKGVDWEGMSKTIEEVFDCFDEVSKGFKDVFGSETSKEALDAIKQEAHINPNNRFAKKIAEFYRGDEKVLEETKKQLSEGLKEMAGSDTHKATFGSVLDEMKELHAKKNSDYGDAAHKNFLKYGPVASLSRLSEKMQRAEHILLSGKCEVKDEPLTETLIDIAITSAMLYMELKNKENG